MDRRRFVRESAHALAIAGAASPLSRLARAPKQTLSLALTGDVILTRRVSPLTDPAFLGVARLLRDADCAFGNCEMVIADPDEGTPNAGGASLTVVSESYVADELKWLGYDIMATSNNHTIDFGPGGVRATLAHLDRVGIAAAGSGRNLQEAAAPRYADTASGRVALVGSASTFAPGAIAVRARGDYPGVHGLNPVRRAVRYQLPAATLEGIRQAQQALAAVSAPPAAPAGTVSFMGTTFVEGPTADLLSDPLELDAVRLEEAVRVARRNARTVITSIHAHEVYRSPTTPDPFVAKLAHRCIDAGADVFVTHGSHLLSGIEVYKGRPIFYGLGDFFFQYETIRAFAADVYDAYGLDPQFADPATATATLPLVGGRKLWESVIPVLQYDGDRLTAIDLHPVTLGADLPKHARGTPTLAVPADAQRIVSELAELSTRYGTRIEWGKDHGRVVLGGTTPTTLRRAR